MFNKKVNINVLGLILACGIFYVAGPGVLIEIFKTLGVPGAYWICALVPVAAIAYGLIMSIVRKSDIEGGF